jgi:hypothetical protein
MILSLPALSSEGFAANARGCRQYPEAVELLGELARAHHLPHLVVIALGANGPIETRDIQQALSILGRGRLLVLLTPRQLGGSPGANAQLVRAAASRNPEQVLALDWVSYSAGHPGWFQPDGLHLTLSGAAAFAALIGEVAPLASPPSPLREPRCTSSSFATHATLSGVATALRGSAIALQSRSHDVQVALTNANAFPVGGVASLRLAGALRVTVATRCVEVPAQGKVTVTLALESQASEDVEFLGHYPVDLGFRLQGPAGQLATIDSVALVVGSSRRPAEAVVAGR